LVLGDLMLDRYTWGDAERVSPEAPVLVLRVETEEARLGGAASVAALLRGLEVEVDLAGVVGGDASGRVLRRLLREAAVDDAHVSGEDARRTTTKDRFLGRSTSRQPQQILRVDGEDRHPLAAESEQTLGDGVCARLPQCQALLISDYAKGVCTPTLLRRVLDAAQQRRIPVLADPGRGVDYERYRGVTLLKPNRSEAQQAAGRDIRSPAEAQQAGARLRAQLDCTAVVITLDRDGLVVCGREGGQWYPADAREVCDITGAGDMAAATLGVCLAVGAPLDAAARLANVAAGLQVERQGVALVTRDDLVRQVARLRTHVSSTKFVAGHEIATRVAAHRAQGRRIVFTNGCFDLLHAGHVSYLQAAAEFGDVLIVAVNSDAGVRRLKGPERPLVGQAERVAMLAALACVDHVLLFDEDTPHQLLRSIRPDVLVKGGTTAEVVGREVVEAYGGLVRVTPTVPGLSTSGIVARIRGEHARHSLRM